MADKEILVDIKVKDKQLKQAIEYAKTLANLLSGEDVDSGELNKQLDIALKNIETLKSAQTKQSKSKLAFGIKTFEATKLELQKANELAKQEKKRATELSKAKAKEIAASEKAAKVLAEEQEAISKQAVTYEQLAKQTAILTKQRKQLNLTSEEGQAEFARLTKILEKNNSQLKDMDGQIGNFQRNVGDYKNQLKGLAPAIGRVGDALAALKTNPVIFLIGAIIGIVAALSKAFSTTERGQQLMAKGTAVLKAGFSLLVTLAEKLATGIQSVFNDPMAALKDFGTGLKDFVIDRFKTLLSGIGSLGRAFAKFVSLDFSGAADEVADFGAALLNLGTGGLATKTTLDLLKGLVSETGNLVDEYNKIEQAKLRQIKANRQVEIQLSKEQANIERLTQLRDDDTISLTLNRKAGDELAKAQAKAAAIEIKAAEGRLDLINKELELKRKSGEIDNQLLDEQKAAIIALQDARSNASQLAAENAERNRKIESDLAELRLDALIDNTNATLMANERIINSEATTADERARLVQENKDLVAKSLVDQVAVLQAYATETIDINDLLATKDAALLDEKLKKLGLSEILTTRQLEVLREQATLQQDLVDIEKDANDLNYEQRLAAFEKQQEIDLLLFEAKKTTAEELAVFELEQEQAKLQAQLDLKAEYGVLFLENEKELIEAQLAANKNALGLLTKVSEKKQILSEKEQQAVTAATNAIIEAFGEQSKAGRIAGIIQKGQTIGRATLAIGEGFAQSAKIGFPQNLVTIAGMATQAAGIYSTIKAVKFERGGLLNGPSHAAGGIDLGHGQEAEGNEYVVNKKSTSAFLPVLDYINTFNNWGDSATHGSKHIFARGGVTASQDALAAGQDFSVQKSIVPVLVVGDVLDAANDISQVIDIQSGF